MISELQELLRSKAIHRYSFIVITVHYVLNNVACEQKNGKVTADIQWSSSNYDYMIVDGEKYLPVNEEGMNSEFLIPVTVMDESMPVIADTTAMGTPHEINYTLTFYSDSIGSKSQMPQEAAKRVVAVALVIIIGGGILNYFVNKRNRC